MTDIVAYLFAGYVVVSFSALYVMARQHESERRDLLNRIMSRDYHEYTYAQAPAEPASTKNPMRDRMKMAAIRQREADDEG